MGQYGLLDTLCPINWQYPGNDNKVLSLLGQDHPGWWGGEKAWDLVGLSGKSPNHGTLANGPTWTPTPYGTGLAFDGSNDYLTVPYAAGGPVAALATQSWGLFFWIKGGSGGAYETIFGTGANTRMHRNASGTGVYFQMAGLSTGLVTTSHAVFDGAWHRVGLTYDGASRVIYNDGDAADTTAATGSPTGDGTADLTFGKDIGGNPYFLGVLTGVTIFNRCPTAADAALDYDQSRRGSPDTLRWVKPCPFGVAVSAASTITSIPKQKLTCKLGSINNKI